MSGISLAARLRGALKAPLRKYTGHRNLESVVGTVETLLRMRGDVGESAVKVSDLAVISQQLLDYHLSTTPHALGGGNARGTVTQATSKSTGVTLNTQTGDITTSNATLAQNVSVSFTLTNSTIGPYDLVFAHIVSGGVADHYQIHVDALSAGSCRIQIRNDGTGSHSEALVIRFVVIKLS